MFAFSMQLQDGAQHSLKKIRKVEVRMLVITFYVFVIDHSFPLFPAFRALS